MEKNYTGIIALMICVQILEIYMIVIYLSVGLNNIYFEKLSHTNVQTEQSGFGRKLQACKDHLPKSVYQLNCQVGILHL